MSFHFLLDVLFTATFLMLFCNPMDNEFWYLVSDIFNCFLVMIVVFTDRTLYLYIDYVNELFESSIVYINVDKVILFFVLVYIFVISSK